MIYACGILCFVDPSLTLQKNNSQGIAAEEVDILFLQRRLRPATPNEKCPHH
jgi:hypothetical protein